MFSIPLYILESTLATQQLWYATAGQRPKQPQKERDYFERLWKRNFELSEIPQPLEPVESREQRSKTFPSSSKGNNKEWPFGEEIPRVYFAKEFNGEILDRGTCPFSNPLSKSFRNHDVNMTMEVPRFRIVRSFDGDVHVEFLVIVTIVRRSTSQMGGSRSVPVPIPVNSRKTHHSIKDVDTPTRRRRSDPIGEFIPSSNHIETYGIWRRHSQFNCFAKILENRCDCMLDRTSGKLNTFQNALLSWQCVIRRKRWFRCFDKEYLSIKCFLLERFMHDVLFESHSPELLYDFLLSPTSIVI